MSSSALSWEQRNSFKENALKDWIDYWLKREMCYIGLINHWSYKIWSLWTENQNWEWMDASDIAEVVVRESKISLLDLDDIWFRTLFLRYSSTYARDLHVVSIGRGYNPSCLVASDLTHVRLSYRKITSAGKCPSEEGATAGDITSFRYTS